MILEKQIQLELPTLDYGSLFLDKSICGALVYKISNFLYAFSGHILYYPEISSPFFWTVAAISRQSKQNLDG